MVSGHQLMYINSTQNIQISTHIISIMLGSDYEILN